MSSLLLGAFAPHSQESCLRMTVHPDTAGVAARVPAAAILDQDDAAAVDALRGPSARGGVSHLRSEQPQPQSQSALTGTKK